jgi:hypothetical protein
MDDDIARAAGREVRSFRPSRRLSISGSAPASFRRCAARAKVRATAATAVTCAITSMISMPGRRASPPMLPHGAEDRRALPRRRLQRVASERGGERKGIRAAGAAGTAAIALGLLSTLWHAPPLLLLWNCTAATW